MPIHVDYDLTIDQIPDECINECTTLGQSVDYGVTSWRKFLEFTVNRERAIQCLKGYGAWELDELNAKSDEDIAEYILWLACGSFKEYTTNCKYEGIDPRGERPDDFDPPSGSNIFVLE